MPRRTVLEMHMPRMDGLETLPVVMFSSSNDPWDMLEAYRLGANSYVDKASPNLPYPELVGLIARYWLLVNESPPGT